MKIAGAEMQQVAKAGSEASGKNGHASGAQIVLSVLRAEGIDTVWGYPGGAVLPLYDALQESVDLTHLLVRHEQAAVHAADGFARATGKVGVALVTSGPGVTNAVTGIATAYFDSIPMVVISGKASSTARRCSRGPLRAGRSPTAATRASRS